MNTGFYQNMTYSEVIRNACEDLVGTCMDKVEDNLAFYLQRAPTESEIEDANQYLERGGIQDCDSCGWWQDDNDGPEGNMCWKCAEDAYRDMEDEDEDD